MKHLLFICIAITAMLFTNTTLKAENENAIPGTQAVQQSSASAYFDLDNHSNLLYFSLSLPNYNFGNLPFMSEISYGPNFIQFRITRDDFIDFCLGGNYNYPSNYFVLTLNNGCRLTITFDQAKLRTLKP